MVSCRISGSNLLSSSPKTYDRPYFILAASFSFLPLSFIQLSTTLPPTLPIISPPVAHNHRSLAPGLLLLLYAWPLLFYCDWCLSTASFLIISRLLYSSLSLFFQQPRFPSPQFLAFNNQPIYHTPLLRLLRFSRYALPLLSSKISINSAAPSFFSTASTISTWLLFLIVTSSFFNFPLSGPPSSHH